MVGLAGSAVVIILTSIEDVKELREKRESESSSNLVRDTHFSEPFPMERHTDIKSRLLPRPAPGVETAHYAHAHTGSVVSAYEVTVDYSFFQLLPPSDVAQDSSFDVLSVP